MNVLLWTVAWKECLMKWQYTSECACIIQQCIKVSIIQWSWRSDLWVSKEWNQALYKLVAFLFTPHPFGSMGYCDHRYLSVCLSVCPHFWSTHYLINAFVRKNDTLHNYAYWRRVTVPNYLGVKMGKHLETHLDGINTLFHQCIVGANWYLSHLFWVITPFTHWSNNTWQMWITTHGNYRTMSIVTQL